MFLTSLQLESFRNIKRAALTFDTSINIFLGPNAAGKTGILEAIGLLSLPKSFRTNQISDLVAFDENYFRVQGEFTMASPENKSIIATLPERGETEDPAMAGSSVEIGYQLRPTKRRLLKVNKAPTTLSRYMKEAYVVTFVPQDLHMIDLGPALRREFLNRVLSKIDFNYLNHLSRYEKALASRNALLKKIGEEGGGSFASLSAWEEIEPWDTQLTESGSFLVMKRLECVAYLRAHLDEHYCEIAGKTTDIGISYRDKALMVAKGLEEDAESLSNDNEPYGREDISAYFKKALDLRRSRDVLTKSTSVGPHRDDLQFSLGDKNIEHFASRGECRTLLVALKIAEIGLIRAHSGKTPLLLLDDVFSELDNERQTQLLHLIKPYQTFITTNSPEHFTRFRDAKTVWHVEGGKVKKQ